MLRAVGAALAAALLASREGPMSEWYGPVGAALAAAQAATKEQPVRRTLRTGASFVAAGQPPELPLLPFTFNQTMLHLTPLGQIWRLPLLAIASSSHLLCK